MNDIKKAVMILKESEVLNVMEELSDSECLSLFEIVVFSDEEFDKMIELKNTLTCL